MITAIEAQKRNKDKVNLYTDGEFRCSLTAESVTRARLKAGSELSDEALEKIIFSSETELAFKKALDFISKSMKSEKQVRDYLTEKGFDVRAAERAVDKLISYGYVNDENFASQYVAFRSAGKGARGIKNELLSKGLSEEVINAAVCRVPKEKFDETAEMLAEKFMRGKTPDLKNLNKLSRFLASRGFEFETINSIIAKRRTDDRD